MSDRRSIQEKLEDVLKLCPRDEKKSENRDVGNDSERERRFPQNFFLHQLSKSLLERARENYPRSSIHWEKIEVIDLRQAFLLQYEIEPSVNNPYYTSDAMFAQLVQEADEQHIWQLMMASLRTGTLRLFDNVHVKPEEFGRWLIKNGIVPAAVFKSEKIPDESSSDIHQNLPAVEPIEKETSCRLRPEQEDKLRCQVIAQILWEENPSRTISGIERHDWIKKFGNGAQYKGKHTIRNWVKEVDPRPPAQKSGRPKKQKTE